MEPKRSYTRRLGDSRYRIEALEKGLLVFEAIEGSAFEPVPIKRIVERCRLPKDTVFRALRTLRFMGWVTQNERGEWTISGRFIRLATKAAEKGEVYG